MNYNPLNKILFTFLIFCIGFVGQSIGQEHIELSKLSEEVSFVNDTSDMRSPRTIKTCMYKFDLVSDSIFAEYQTIDTRMDIPNASSDTLHLMYRLSVSDIKEMKVDSYLEILDFGYTRDSTRYSNIKIFALRDKDLFRESRPPYYTNSEKSEIRIPIYLHQDTTKFQEIIGLLDANSSIGSNSMKATCEVGKLRLDLTGELFTTAIENLSLSTGIKVNGNEDLEGEFNSLIKPFLKENDLNLATFSVVIDEKDNVAHIVLHQKLFAERYKNAKEGETNDIVKKAMGYNITDDQVKELESIIGNQRWESGTCNGGKVRSVCSLIIGDI